MQRAVSWGMAPRKKPLKRPPPFIPKKPQDIKIPAKDVLFLEKISKGKASLEKAPPASLKYGGAKLKVWKEDMTFVDSVKVVATECHNRSKWFYREPIPKDLTRFLNSIETKSDDLFHLLSEGKEEGHFRLSFAEEELLAGTLTIDDHPAVQDLTIIKNLRRDLELLKDLIGRKRELQKEGKVVDSMFDEMRKRQDQGQPIGDDELTNFLVKEHTLEHHYASELVNQKHRRLYSRSKKGRPENSLIRFTVRDVIELCTNWSIDIKRHEPDKPAGDEEPSQASSSDFFRIQRIVFSAAGREMQYLFDDWKKYKEDPVEPLP